MTFYKLLFFILFIAEIIYAQNPPADFKLVATTGGTAPWSVSESITLLADGTAEYVKINGEPPQILIDTTFNISTANLQQIWQAVQNTNFFSLNNSYLDDSVQDGSHAIFTITANGITKQILIKNIKQQEIQNIITAINANVPAEYNLDYTPPEKLNIIPQDPCNSTFGSSFSIDKKNLSKASLAGLLTKNNSVNSAQETIPVPHPPVEIGYEESLFEAVMNGTASLQAKGDGYYGDDVSITGDYSPDFTPSSKTVDIKLHLEFYGACDNDANELKVVKDIYNKWNGVMTSNGKKIQMDISVVSHPGAAAPPGTPGFDDIELACGDGRSYCNSVGTPNADITTGGKWFPSDNRPGVFGHEVGHLLGLADQYTDWSKQPDGSWKNSKDGTTLNSDDFLNLFHSRHPKDDINYDKKIIEKASLIGIAVDNHIDDLMGDIDKPPLQSDIDKIAAQAGLIININPGDILINTDNLFQNFTVTHLGDLFLKLGESETLNGIYAACIDHFALPPDPAMKLAVAPPLNTWNGIKSAPPLLKLLHYIDSLGYYCNLFDYSFAQEAIWKITDNAAPFDSAADSLLINAGVDISQTFDFPKMLYNLNDSASSSYIPDQLFVADIEPKSVDAKINEKVNFSASLSAPSVGHFSTDFSWILNSPNPNAAQFMPNGADASLTPLQRGFYSLNLDVTLNDSTGSIRNLKPAATSYAVVADKFTETFEHNNLNDLFNWKTYGDAPWTITNKTAQTGNFSLQPGNFGSSTLEMTIDLPSDSIIAFAVKSNTSTGIMVFLIDSTAYGFYSQYNDWTFVTHPVPAGIHTLMWIYHGTEVSSNTTNGIWLDNIFFPTNSKLLTSIESPESLPLSFNLFQNYPNPFNPSTIIKYSLTEVSSVKLLLYDALGRKVKDLFTGRQNAGVHEINFNASDLSSGVYFYSIEATYSKGTFKKARKMILVK